jgi:tRNA(Ile)-lysidine synthase
MRTGPDSALGLACFPAIHPALQASILRMFIAERRGSLRGLTRAHVEALRRLCLDGPSNGEIDLPGRWSAARQYQFLSVERAIPRSEENFAMPLALEGTTIVAAAGFAFDAKILDATDAALPRDNDSALFDLGALQAGAADAPLTVRNFVRGDRIAPLGMEGSRKLKEIFIDRKVPRARRASYPVVTLRGEIVWLPGLARGRGALLTSATETVLRVAARGVGN